MIVRYFSGPWQTSEAPTENVTDAGIVGLYLHGRFHCQPCNRVGRVMHTPDQEIRCPFCGGPVLESNGDEAA